MRTLLALLGIALAKRAGALSEIDREPDPDAKTVGQILREHHPWRKAPMRTPTSPEEADAMLKLRAQLVGRMMFRRSWGPVARALGRERIRAAIAELRRVRAQRPER